MGNDQSIVGSPPIIRQALGRTAVLGDLNDARTDTFCTTSIFKKKLSPNSDSIETTDNRSSIIIYTESGSLEEIMSKLNVGVQLKLSILAGCATPEGSAKYLKEKKKSFRSVESALVYDITAVTEQLNLDQCQ